MPLESTKLPGKPVSVRQEIFALVSINVVPETASQISTQYQPYLAELIRPVSIEISSKFALNINHDHTLC